MVYAAAVQEMNQNTISAYEKAIKQFQSISDWKDSCDKIAVCNTRIESIREKEKEREEQRVRQERLAAALARKRKMTALITLASLAVVVALWFLVIAPIFKYNQAVNLMETGQYDEAIEIFEDLGGYKDSADQIKECRYQNAIVLMGAGDYKSAIEELNSIGDFKDSAGKKMIAKRNFLSNAGFGDTVYWGTYEQNNDLSDGQEDIEWIIIARKNGKVLLLSKDVLDAVPFSDDQSVNSWAESSIRTWANTTFYDSAFSQLEKNYIQTTMVSTPRDAIYDTSGSETTQDKVFLLSTQEVTMYLDSSERCAYGSEYAINNCGRATGAGALFNWYLRTPGKMSGIYSVSSTGSIFNSIYLILCLPS